MPESKTPQTWQPRDGSGAKVSPNGAASILTRTGEDDKWDRFIDLTLAEWERDPTVVEDEGIDAPSRAIVSQAIELARRLRDAGRPAPSSMVPDPNGGIVFQRHANDISEEYHIWDDGVVEYLCLQGAKLIERRRVG